MLLIDRVLCDCCGLYIGQLYGQPASQTDRIINASLPPHFAICPDCEPYEKAADKGVGA